MSENTISGKIKVIGATETFGANGFKKRELVVTTDTDKYPQMILIEFTQAKVDLLDKFTIGDSVEVSINIRGREWLNPQGEAKYFNSLQGWRIVKLGGAASAPNDQAPPPF